MTYSGILIVYRARARTFRDAKPNMSRTAPPSGDALAPHGELLSLDGFGEALLCIRSALAECDALHVSSEAVLAALLSELLPRLVDQYGTNAVSGVFGRLARSVASTAGQTAGPSVDHELQ